MTGRPRVLHLRVAAGTGGGPEKTILNSPRHIAPYGYDAQVVYLTPPRSDIASRLRQQALLKQCPLVTFDDRGPVDPFVVGKTILHCRRERIDILQAHDYKSNVIALIVRCFHRCRLATMLHGWTDMSGRMPIYKQIDLWPFHALTP